MINKLIKLTHSSSVKKNILAIKIYLPSLALVQLRMENIKGHIKLNNKTVYAMNVVMTNVLRIMFCEPGIKP